MAKLSPVIRLTQEQIAHFHREGFVVVPQICPPAEVKRLHAVFERLFEQKAGRQEGAQIDMVTHDAGDTPQALPAIINPVHFAPELRDTSFRANAAAVAKQLLGPTVSATFEHAILKPACYGAATPWHQDEATRVDDNFEYEQISIWMPLQEATVENGCMSYVPRTHRGEVLPHRSPGDDPKVHAIECAGGFDEANALPCPVPAGGAAIHHGRTLHCAGPNRTSAPRHAYILAFELPPKPSTQSRNFFWNHDKQAAGMQRRRAWRKRGGVLVEFGRKLRAGMWKCPDRLLFEARRALRALLKR